MVCMSAIPVSERCTLGYTVFKRILHYGPIKPCLTSAQRSKDRKFLSQVDAFFLRVTSITTASFH
jgi:hypothetical protein